MMENPPSSLLSIWILRMCLFQNHPSLDMAITILPIILLLLFKVAVEDVRDQLNLPRTDRGQLTFKLPKLPQQLTQQLTHLHQ